MVVLMPTAGSLETFEQSLTADSLQGILNNLERAMVTLSMPKFKFEAAFGLNDTLKTLGMTDAFDPYVRIFSHGWNYRFVYLFGAT